MYCSSPWTIQQPGSAATASGGEDAEHPPSAPRRRFDRSYCNDPLCNPTRTSLLSGRRPETTQVFNNTTPPRTHLGDVVFLPEYYKAQGYFTARVGKIAHGTYEYQVKWDISESSAGVPISSGRGLKDEDTALDRVRRKRSAKKQNRAGRQAKQAEAGGGGVKLSWTPTNRADADEPDGATARRIVQIIRENKSKPFFVGCGFHKPHLPWVAPRKYFDMYSLDQINCRARRRRLGRHPSHRADLHQGRRRDERPRTPAGHSRLSRRHQLHGRATRCGARLPGSQ
jgi:arylsulfatase A-like enzyme